MNLLETEEFPLLLRRGRWALALTEAAISLFLALWYRERPPAAWVSMGLLLTYNMVVLAQLYRLSIWRIPIRLLVVLDLLFLGNAAYYTGAATSPYLGLCYLIVFVAALFGDLKGGLGVGLLAGLMTVALGFMDNTNHWEIVRDTAPYFLIVGGFTGYLVTQMKTYFTRYQEGLARELEQKQTEQTHQHELELAREIQQSSLLMTVPELPGLKLVLRTQPSHEVGGDFHAFITDSATERLGLAVGDVAGKGIAAALVATSIGSLLPYLDPLRGAHHALVRLNKDLCGRLPTTTFATLLYAEIEASAGTLRLWNAGHPPALIWRARDGHVESASCGQAPPLGLFAIWRAPEQELTLAPGDLLILHSDGITEARTGDGHSYFDEARLLDIIRAHAPHGPEALADAIFTALHEGGEPSDDLTLLLCQRTR
ncbi:PP2C family protein-serine/threonine phosphatase [Armatimonas sp.]|uniref:PP2C family protein-serine/threonine phosphatase n=1 Tax=Armatimonas sp. TaxID=1872638 RepID=UPI00286B69C4|nr:PP2C family protein-serine/threonine phosphatase [Armatimonas sp.]